MPFQKVETSVDFPALERQVLKFWDEQQIFEKRKKLNEGKPRWSFLDGPITANNPMGVHHAWNRTYKDVYNRYFAMTGHELRYQQGFDCQGLWVEVEVEKELKLQSKRDIENLVPGDSFASIDRFVTACKNRVNHFARFQTEQSIRLGYWMNWDRTDADWAKTPDERHSYFTMSEANNYTIWSFLKKCHCKKLISRGYDVMPWCGRCGVGISEQEMKEGYKLIEHRACFVKFPLVDKPGENLLVWTTTPWTLTSNIGAAINPKLTYLRVKLKNEIYYISKGAFKLDRMASGGDDPEGGAAGGSKKREWLKEVPHLSSIEQMFKSKAGKEGFEILGEVKGEEMLGWKYAGPFDELPAQQHPYGFPDEVARIVQQNGWCPAVTGQAAHRIVSGGDDVTETEGTGIVHTAPGCGGIDFQWGKENGLPPVAPIGDDGCFHEGFGPLTRKNAADPGTADLIFEELKKKDRLFTIERYVHRYPHCWRCKTELLYRLVDEWFINMGPKNTEEGFRGEIMKVVDQVTFLPESINGRARERDWLKNMGDWMISKKRYWGLALPIWVDEKDPTDFEVIGSREELQARAIEGWTDFDGHTPHRPWVDKIVLINPRTGNRMHRIPDVGNPWLDAGIVAFSTMKYGTDLEYWKKWYPADFITESFPGQFRNWFYALLALSTMMSDGLPPFKTLLGFATVQDQFGKPMHKSDGNSIEFIGAADDGFELFRDIDPKKDAKEATKELPKGQLQLREEAVTVQGQPMKRVFAKYKPIGADVIRWLFCRQNPSQNLNFGPEPTDEVRAKFLIKLWNCYSFFVNYAIADGFDATQPLVPVQDRPDIDRWIIAEINELIRDAKAAYEAYDIAPFCNKAEKFLDEKFSNWYIRRNRSRFHSRVEDLSEEGKSDKWSAYQTTHLVLATFCKLIAPCTPFIAETIWQNLRKVSSQESQLELDCTSVHLCSFPNEITYSVASTLNLVYNVAKPPIEETKRGMRSVIRIVSIGMGLRNLSKHKVRQPLQELRIQVGTKKELAELSPHVNLIKEELNVKAVVFHVKEETKKELLDYRFNPNYKIVRTNYPDKIDIIRQNIDQGTYKTIPTEDGSPPPIEINIDGDSYQLQEDMIYERPCPDGWKIFYENNTQVMLDIRLTDELKLEGLSRDVIRFVQDARKNAGLEMLDKIELHLKASGDLARAIDTHRTTIATATQATKWAESPAADAFTATVKVENEELAIALKKAR